MSRTYTATAVPWAQGWELHVDGVGVTQVRVLDKAVQQVRDLIGTMLDIDADDVPVSIRYDLHGLEKEIADAKERMRTAREEQNAAAEHMRRLVAELRRDGLSVSDIAHVLEVSRGRVSQLVGG